MTKLIKALHISWPYVALLVAHFIWGANYLAAKLTLNEIPPLSLAFLRFSLAAILLLPFLISDLKSFKIKQNDLPKLVLVGVLMVTLHITFFYQGLAKTTITSASVLLLLIPILSVIFAWAWANEKINLYNLTGVIAGLIGALILLGFGNLIFLQQSNPGMIVGNIFIVLSAITWVLGAVLSKKVLKEYSTLTVTWVMFLVGTITFLFPALNEYIQNPHWIDQVSLLGVLGLGYITLASSISAYFLFEWGVKKLGVIKADFFAYLEPGIAIVLGVLVLSEKLDPSFFIGAALIACGAILGTSKANRHSKSHRG